MKLPKNSKRLAWLGLAAILLVYTLFSLETDPAFLACANAQPEMPGKILAQGRCAWNAFNESWSGIAAGASILVAAFAWKILGAIRQLTLETKETAERNQRAYVMVAKGRVTLEVGQFPSFKITLKNFGRTPAYDVVHWSNVGFDFFPATEEFDWGVREDRPVRGPLAPGAKLHSYPVRSRPLAAHELEELQAGDVALYVTGTVTYRDVFGESQVTQYCLFVGGPAGAARDMAPYHDGNHAS